MITSGKLLEGGSISKPPKICDLGTADDSNLKMDYEFPLKSLVIGPFIGYFEPFEERHQDTLPPGTECFYKIDDSERPIVHLLHSREDDILYTQPEIIENDYQGLDLAHGPYAHIDGVSIHRVVKNPLPAPEDHTLLEGRSSAFQFTEIYGATYNKVVMGMIVVWRKNCLELLDAAVKGGVVTEESIEEQKTWINNNVVNFILGIRNFHHRVPLVLLKDKCLPKYLGKDVLTKVDHKVFLTNMVACRRYDIVSIVINDEHDNYQYVVATRFDKNDDLFFVFGYKQE